MQACIYLPEDLYRRLKERASATGKSMAEQIRESLDRYFTESEAASPKPEDPIWRIAGNAAGAESDLSTRHDQYLYGEAQGAPAGRPAKNTRKKAGAAQ
ncbi:MAG: CopG family transcriptional regulator [Firmicutes bacterium]|nr:CopG family transcriptional regulator [Bacillota bacterium]